MVYKSKDVTRLVGIPAATLRDWRSQNRDFEGVWGEEKSKDHTYTKRGLLSLGAMKVMRDSGATVESAWSVSFWAVNEIAKWIEIWEMEPWIPGQGNVIKTTTKARWVIETGGNPIVTDNATYIADASAEPGDSCRIEVIDLMRLSRNLPSELVEEIGGRRNPNWT